jgi:hypothetical protein
MVVFHTSCGQTQTNSPKENIKSETKDIVTSPGSNKKYHTKYEYTDSIGKRLIIQNSFPKGGPYIDPAGKRFGHAIFWTRVINETATPIEFTINFPADSFSISSVPQAYFKLFLPTDTMTIDKELEYGYGATGLKSFMDTGLNKPTTLQRTIHPKKEYLFYVGMLMKMPDNGPVRTGLVLKEDGLFYRVSIAGQLDSALIPCGQIVFKK